MDGEFYSKMIDGAFKAVLIFGITIGAGSVGLVYGFYWLCQHISISWIW